MCKCGSNAQFTLLKIQLAWQSSGSAVGQKWIHFSCLCSTWSKSWRGPGVKTSSNWKLWELRGSCWDVDTCNDARTSGKGPTTNTHAYAKCMNAHQKQQKSLKTSETIWMFNKCLLQKCSICGTARWFLTERRQRFRSIRHGFKQGNNGA